MILYTTWQLVSITWVKKKKALSLSLSESFVVFAVVKKGFRTPLKILFNPDYCHLYIIFIYYVCQYLTENFVSVSVFVCVSKGLAASEAHK